MFSFRYIVTAARFLFVCHISLCARWLHVVRFSMVQKRYIFLCPMQAPEAYAVIPCADDSTKKNTCDLLQHAIYDACVNIKVWS